MVESRSRFLDFARMTLANVRASPLSLPLPLFCVIGGSLGTTGRLGGISLPEMVYSRVYKYS